MCLAENPAGVGVGRNQQLQRADIDVRAERPEVRLLEIIDALQLLHLHSDQRIKRCILKKKERKK